MRGSWVPLWVLLLLLLGTADGYLNGKIARCEFNSTDPDDIQFIDSWFYNKLEFVRFDSNVGRFVGYTEFGVRNAERWNNNTALLETERRIKYTYCAHNVENWYSKILSKSVAPYAELNLVFSGGTEKVLVCSVYSFYPRDISVTWTNHGQKIHDGVTTTDLLPNSDWYYQVHSQLEYSPRSGDKISCVIEHISLKEPMVLDYDGAVTDQGDIMKVVIGASGLVLGLVMALAGFVSHKSKGLFLDPKH